MLVWCICFVFILISEQIQVAYLKNTNERDILWLNTPVHVNIETLCCSDFVCCAFAMSLFPDLKDECIIIVSVWCRSEMGFDWLCGMPTTRLPSNSFCQSVCDVTGQISLIYMILFWKERKKCHVQCERKLRWIRFGSRCTAIKEFHYKTETECLLIFLDTSGCLNDMFTRSIYFTWIHPINW